MLYWYLICIWYQNGIGTSLTFFTKCLFCKVHFQWFSNENMCPPVYRPPQNEKSASYLSCLLHLSENVCPNAHYCCTHIPTRVRHLWFEVNTVCIAIHCQQSDALKIHTQQLPMRYSTIHNSNSAIQHNGV